MESLSLLYCPCYIEFKTNAARAIYQHLQEKTKQKRVKFVHKSATRMKEFTVSDHIFNVEDKYDKKLFSYFITLLR